MEKYILANCCHPAPPDNICGYYSHDGYLKVHRDDCPNLSLSDNQRLVHLEWEEIVVPQATEPADDFQKLDETDFAFLRHHRDLGIDYSLKVARVLNISQEVAFERHRTLRNLGLLERVEPTMVQHRKGVVRHKWVKHRNHTYYNLTAKGKLYLEYFEKDKPE